VCSFLAWLPLSKVNTNGEFLGRNPPSRISVPENGPVPKKLANTAPQPPFGELHAEVKVLPLSCSTELVTADSVEFHVI